MPSQADMGMGKEICRVAIRRHAARVHDEKSRLWYGKSLRVRFKPQETDREEECRC
jgi:hypothetical protein